MTASSILTDNILPFWMNRVQNPAGGFYGRIDGNGKLHPEAPRGGILNARILWTFSAAYRVLGNPEYLQTALRARDQILGPFWDSDFGGTYWSLDCEGRPLETKKQIYSIAFAIYGLSELYRASGDELALQKAVELYQVIEEHSLDPVCGGYFEAFRRDWSPIEDMRLSDKDQNDAKTMNTHLHILEGYASLYRVWKDKGLESSLRKLIEIFLDRIILPNGHLALFFDADWNCTSHVVSYGHDIECSWLLAEDAEVLGDDALIEKVNEVCSRMAEAAVQGWTPLGGMAYEKDLKDGKVDADRHWWVQAENVVGCVWQWKRSGKTKWLDCAKTQLRYIEDNLLAPDGEWYWSRRADGSINTEDDRAGFWKCPYHNGRMCMELMDKYPEL